MKYIKKVWLRILISIFSGSILAELFHMKTGNSSNEVSNSIMIITAIIIFCLLTFYVLFDKYKHYYFSDKSSEDNDILDDFN